VVGVECVVHAGLVECVVVALHLHLVLIIVGLSTAFLRVILLHIIVGVHVDVHVDLIGHGIRLHVIVLTWWLILMEHVCTGVIGEFLLAAFPGRIAGGIAMALPLALALSRIIRTAIELVVELLTGLLVVVGLVVAIAVVLVHVVPVGCVEVVRGIIRLQVRLGEVVHVAHLVQLLP